MQIELRIDHHPSGNRTLKQREVGKEMWADVRDELFANSNEAAFYRAVVKYVGSLLEAGDQVMSLTDASP